MKSLSLGQTQLLTHVEEAQDISDSPSLCHTVSMDRFDAMLLSNDSKFTYIL